MHSPSRVSQINFLGIRPMGNGTRGSQPKIQPNSSINDKTAISFPYGAIFDTLLLESSGIREYAT